MNSYPSKQVKSLQKNFIEFVSDLLPTIKMAIQSSYKDTFSNCSHAMVISQTIICFPILNLSFNLILNFI